jgi:tetratricopeptide (TPR) repeat protein
MKKPLLHLATWLLATCTFAETATPIQEREAVAEKFGREIAQALNDRDRAAAAGLIASHGLAERAADYQGLTGRSKTDFVGGVEKAGAESIVATFFRALDTSEGTVKYIRVTRQFPPRSLVRFDLGDRGFNYCEFVVVKDATGHARAVDWYQISTGDLMSVTLGGIGQLFAGDPGLIERLLGARPDTTALNKLRRIGELQRAGKYSEALDVYKQLPEPIANSRIMLTARASAAIFAQRTDEYHVALEKLAQHYSSDPGAAFMLLDHYFKQQDMPKLLKAIDAVEQRVGADGITSIMRSNAYFQVKDVTNALKYAEESIRLEPDRLDPYDVRATYLVNLGRFPEAVTAYREIETRFGVKFSREIFVDEPSFEKFVASAAFRAWLPK